jgi:hypothetical protein
MTIVLSCYRYKPSRRRKSNEAKAAPAESTPANADRKPATAARPAAIVTARRSGKRYVDVREVTEEDHRRVGDLADAMMAEYKRVIAEKNRS